MNGEPRNWCWFCQDDHTRYDQGHWGERTPCPKVKAPKLHDKRELTTTEIDAAMRGYDNDDGLTIKEPWGASVTVYGENGFVTLMVLEPDGVGGEEIHLAESECRKLAAALVHLADTWCVS